MVNKKKKHQGHLGAGTTANSNANDYYITPDCMTNLLFKKLDWKIKATDSFYDPACGEKNNIIKNIEIDHKYCYYTDLTEGFDYLTGQLNLLCDWIITNPPYKIKSEFLKQAFKNKPNKGIIFLIPTRWKFSLEFYKILTEEKEYYLNTEFTFNRQLELSDSETENVKAGMALYSWMVFTKNTIPNLGFSAGETILDIQPYIIKKGSKNEKK